MADKSEVEFLRDELAALRRELEGLRSQGQSPTRGGCEQVGDKFLDEGLDVRKPPAASLASSGPEVLSSAKLAVALSEGRSAKEQLRAILEGDPDFEGWVRDLWERFFGGETEAFCALLVEKYRKHLPRRPGAYLSKVAKEKGRWVRAA